jgi:threonine/homoserine/homoserine lactone efflux protein
MGQAIGDMLPAAIGVAISPLPIVAVVLMLVSAGGRINGVGFLVGWVVGVAGVGTVVLVLASDAGASDEGQPAGWVAWLKLALGGALLLLALRNWRGRPRGDDEPVTPSWMGALDAFSPPKAGGAAVVLSAVNPKNLLLIVAGATAIARTGIPAGEQAGALAIFTVIASLGVAAPLVMVFALGERSSGLLDRLKAWLTHNNAVIMTVLLVVIGVKLIGDAISGFSA